MDQELSAFVANRFAEVHSASPQLDYARWCRVDDGQSRPAATLATPVATCTGVVLVEFPPLPSCPCAFEPVAQSVPSVFRYKLCSYPAAIAATPLAICTGVLRLVVVPLPN